MKIIDPGRIFQPKALDEQGTSFSLQARVQAADQFLVVARGQPRVVAADRVHRLAPPQRYVAQARAQLLAQPWWLDWTAGLFPVILVVFALGLLIGLLACSMRLLRSHRELRGLRKELDRD